MVSTAARSNGEGWREALLLSRRHDVAVHKERGSAVMVVSRESENAHATQNNVYMNGAMAEPCASTNSPPKISMIRMIDSIQSFFLTRKTSRVRPGMTQRAPKTRTDLSVNQAVDRGDCAVSSR